MRILILILISISGFAQNEAAKTQTSYDSKEYVSNFVVVDGNIIWRKVFGQSVSIRDYEKFLKLGGHLDNIEVSEIDSVIIGRLRSSKLSFVGFNEDSWFNGDVPAYLKWLLVNGDIKIEVKNDKYRITIYNFKLIAEATISFWQKGQEDQLDLYYYKPFSKKKYVRDSFTQYSEPIFNKNFIDKYQYKSIKSDF
jgi:hypothetical protein